MPLIYRLQWAEDEGPDTLAGDNQDDMGLGLKYLRIQWASQENNSAIAALEAAECIDTTDEGPEDQNAAISPSWLLSVFCCKLDNSL